MYVTDGGVQDSSWFSLSSTGTVYHDCLSWLSHLLRQVMWWCFSCPPRESASISTNLAYQAAGAHSHIGTTWGHDRKASKCYSETAPELFIQYSKHLPFLILLTPLKALQGYEWNLWNFGQFTLNRTNYAVHHCPGLWPLHCSQGLHWGLPATTSTECPQSKGLALTGGYGSESVRPSE